MLDGHEGVQRAVPFRLTFWLDDLVAGKATTEREWAEAAQRCRLSSEEVRMARELGFKPRGLIANIPNKAEPWKAPVAAWLHELYKKRQLRTEQRRRRRERAGGQDVAETHTGSVC
jgi:hypothetical protein